MNNILFNKLDRNVPGIFQFIRIQNSAIIQGIAKVISIATGILESTLCYQWQTFWTWSLDTSQGNHNVFPHFWSLILLDFSLYFHHPISLALWQILLNHTSLTSSLIRMKSLIILHFTIYLFMTIKVIYDLLHYFLYSAKKGTHKTRLLSVNHWEEFPLKKTNKLTFNLKTKMTWTYYLFTYCWEWRASNIQPNKVGINFYLFNFFFGVYIYHV